VRIQLSRSPIFGGVTIKDGRFRNSLGPDRVGGRRKPSLMAGRARNRTEVASGQPIGLLPALAHLRCHSANLCSVYADDFHQAASPYWEPRPRDFRKGWACGVPPKRTGQRLSTRPSVLVERGREGERDLGHRRGWELPGENCREDLRTICACVDIRLRGRLYCGLR